MVPLDQPDVPRASPTHQSLVLPPSGTAFRDRAMVRTCIPCAPLSLPTRVQCRLLQSVAGVRQRSISPSTAYWSMAASSSAEKSKWSRAATLLQLGDTARPDED